MHAAHKDSELPSSNSPYPEARLELGLGLVTSTFEGDPRQIMFAFHHQPVPFRGVVANRCRFSFDNAWEIAMGFASYSPMTMLGICIFALVMG